VRRPKATVALVATVLRLSPGTTRVICVADVFVISGTTFVLRHIYQTIFGTQTIFEPLSKGGISEKSSRFTVTTRVIDRSLARR